MRKLVCLFLLGIASVRVLGQSNMYLEPGQEPKTFQGGIGCGLNFSQVDGDTYAGFHKVAINAGAMVYTHFSRIWGASMEINYTRKGSRAETQLESPNVGTYIESYYLKVNYVEVPLVFHCIYDKTYDIEVGASFAYLVSSSESVYADRPVVIDPVINRFNTSDIDALVGVTHKIYKQLYGNVRYQYSLTSIRPYERVPYGYGSNSKGQFNNLFTLRFEYLF